MPRKNVSNVSVKVTTDTKAAVTGLDKFERKINGVGKTINRFKGILSGALAVAGISAAVNAVTRLGRAWFEVSAGIDKTAKQAAQLGESFGDIRDAQFAVEKLTGLGADQTFAVLRRFDRRAGDVIRGTGPIKAFEELGIVAEDFQRLKTKDKLLAVAEAFARIDKTRRLSILGQLGDIEALPLISALAENTEQLRAELGKFSSDRLTDQEVMAVTEMRDKFRDIEERWRSVKEGVAADPRVLKAFGELADALNRLLSDDKFIDSLKDLVANLAKLLETYLPAIGQTANVAATGSSIGTFYEDIQPFTFRNLSNLSAYWERIKARSQQTNFGLQPFRFSSEPQEFVAPIVDAVNSNTDAVRQGPANRPAMVNIAPGS